MPKLAVLPFALCVVFVVAGCSKHETLTEPDETAYLRALAQLTGTWSFQSATVDGVSASLTQVFNRKATTASEYMLITGEGVYEVDDYGPQPQNYYDDPELLYTEAGNISATSHDFSVVINSVDGQNLNPSQQRSGQWEANGIELILTINDGGKTAKLYYKRYQ